MANVFFPTDEMIVFIKKVLLLTRSGKLAWETTADPDILIAPLGSTYMARLNLVPDFDGNAGMADPDYILTIAKAGKALFSVDRRDFDANKILFKNAFSDVISEDYFPYHLFKEIWERAYFKSTKIAEELTNIISILDDIK